MGDLQPGPGRGPGWLCLRGDRTARDEGFVHRAGPGDTFGNVTYLDDPLVNGDPDAALSATQNWNPGGGGRGVYNDHPVGVLYDEDVSKWYVYNEDAALMPEGAAFNVAVSGSE